MLDRVRAPGEADPDQRPDTQDECLVAVDRSWRLVGASRRGTAHEASGADREDAFAIHLVSAPDGPPWFCLAVADGVGSARFARVGARRAVESFMDVVRGLTSAPAPPQLRTLLSVAAWEAKLELAREAERRGQLRKELGTTLLAVLGVQVAPGTIDLGIFQVGNGLIACTAEDEPLRVLLDPGDETADGSIYDLTSDHLQHTWDDSRFKHVRLDPAPWAIVIMTDGLSDDLVPLRSQAPALLQALHALPPSADASGHLLAEISYVKRGSGDDRTLACALLGPPPDPPPFVPQPEVSDAAASTIAVAPAEPPAFEPPGAPPDPEAPS